MTDEIKSRFYEVGFEVADHTSAMLAYWDKNLVCRYANAAYIEWFGKSPADMIDKITLHQLLGPLFALNLPFITEVLKGKVQVFERDIKIPDGQVKSTIATYCPDFANQEVRGFFVHVADVTPLKNRQNSNIIPNDGLTYNDHLITQVQETLKACLFTKFPGIAALARQHFISETKLKKGFKTKFNTTIFSYYRELQMELAHRYLSEKKCSKKQVSILLNFSNQANFSACYNKYLSTQKTKRIIAGLQKQNENLHKTFTEQVPFAMAMLDNDLGYLAYSQKWQHYFKAGDDTVLNVLKLYNLGQNANDWELILSNCLQGTPYSSNEQLIEFIDGRQLWIKWDIRPWYQQNDMIGGVIIAADDVTAIKQRDIENQKLLEILNKTNEITRTGAWKRNFDNGTAIWSKILKEILEVPPDFEPTVELAFNFYKEGKDRDLVKAALHSAITHGTPFDIEATLVSAKGNLKRVRVIGYPEFSNGVCHKLSGIFQELSNTGSLS
ncbi:PAS domain-containing protein [Mucilaginibacter celer]|uniref:Helix-turn-helix domain-containing protein n=1 Tax=Mucilaginibacter celer TaxID=2305508 RepID=A0A494VV53_9SPHI|nr:PAS domain-containing protein [Mucilaginibacter celer]AYL95168.1 helix-turn-helix domain-containing protein [Mucilaginibacter celer]